MAKKAAQFCLSRFFSNLLEAFMEHCNVTKPPQIDRGLFS